MSNFYNPTLQITSNLGVFTGFWEIKSSCLPSSTSGSWWFHIVSSEIHVKKHILSSEVFYITYFSKKYSVHYTYIEPFSECLSSSALIRFRAGNKAGLGLTFFGEAADMKIKSVNLFESKLTFRKHSQLEDTVPKNKTKEFTLSRWISRCTMVGRETLGPVFGFHLGFL